MEQPNSQPRPKPALTLLPNTEEEIEAKRRQRWELGILDRLLESGLPRRFDTMGFSTSPWLTKHKDVLVRLTWRQRERDQTESRLVIRADGAHTYTDDRTDSQKHQDDQDEADQEASVLFWGPTGTGKTAIAGAILTQYIEHTGGDGYFRTVPNLLTELRGTFGGAGNESALIEKYCEASILVLDDLGAEHLSGSGWLEDRLYQIIGNRHDEQRKTIFTSNLSLAELGKRLGERITWRIVEMCGEHIYHVDGPNLRDRKQVSA